jgi:hypothetical protein
VQPETNTKSPAATARLYPTTGSHGVPVEILRVTRHQPSAGSRIAPSAGAMAGPARSAAA